MTDLDIMKRISTEYNWLLTLKVRQERLRNIVGCRFRPSAGHRLVEMGRSRQDLCRGSA